MGNEQWPMDAMIRLVGAMVSKAIDDANPRNRKLHPAAYRDARAWLVEVFPPLEKVHFWRRVRATWKLPLKQRRAR